MKVNNFLSLSIFNIFPAAATKYLLDWDKPSATRKIEIKELKKLYNLFQRVQIPDYHSLNDYTDDSGIQQDVGIA